MKTQLKAIKPTANWSAPMLAALDKALERMRPLIEFDLRAITATWKHRVKWTVKKGSNYIQWETTDPPFIYLELGTRPHAIRARRAKALKFQAGYSAKTTPGVLGSGPGGPFGETLFRPSVMHPGTKPRKWIDKIKEREQPQFERIVREELAKVKIK